MINSVRNTVLAILNKNNYGYISPSDFNLFSKQAQLDIFDEYFVNYNSQINKENARVSGTEYADIRKGMEEVIDYFSITSTLIQDSGNIYFLPSPTTTGYDYYLIKVNHSKITMLNNSLLTKPSELYPAYTQEAGLITIYPNTFNAAGNVVSQYIRYPRDPKWTYISVLSGEPIFDQTQVDYQDFELPIEDETRLVNRILQYAGMSIREIQAIQFAAGEEQQENQS